MLLRLYFLSSWLLLSWFNISTCLSLLSCSFSWKCVFSFAKSEQIAQHTTTSSNILYNLHTCQPWILPYIFTPLPRQSITPAANQTRQPTCQPCLPPTQRNPALPLCHHLLVFLMIIMQEQILLLQRCIFPGLLLQITLVQPQAFQPLLLRAPDLQQVLQLICNSLLISPLILSSSSQVQVLLHLILLLVSIPWFFILNCRRLPFWQRLQPPLLLLFVG